MEQLNIYQRKYEKANHKKGTTLKKESAGHWSSNDSVNEIY